MFIPKVEEIKRRRLEAGLSRQKLSLLAGLPKNAVYRIELDQAGYTYPIRARALAEALHCEVEDICFTTTYRRAGMRSDF